MIVKVKFNSMNFFFTRIKYQQVIFFSRCLKVNLIHFRLNIYPDAARTSYVESLENKSDIKRRF